MLKVIKNFIRARLRKALLEEIWLEDYIKMGMKIGENCSIREGVVFDYSHCWLIEIGNNVSIAPQAYLLTHDASTKKLKDFKYTKLGNIKIEDNVFIGARAMIMPGVTIGKNSIIAAASVVTKSVPQNSIVAGNPARIISNLEKYEDKILKQFSDPSTKTYNSEYTIKGNITQVKKEEMKNSIRVHQGFVI